MQSVTDNDRQFMHRAHELARQGRFTASPNPRVGCVIVKSTPGSPQEFLVIGEGFHLRKGCPHAEREALAACKEDPQGATLYVNLEPCCHHGNTPPCTDAILEAGISRVVCSILDPFPQVSGKGIEILRQNGVQVDVGALQAEARFLNRFFLHHQEQGLPWVILKAAMTLDGKLSTHSGHSKWITGEITRAHVHEVRAECDAVLAGIGTVLADNPSLTARPQNIAKDEFTPPRRVILDPYLDIPLDSKVFQLRDEAPVWIFSAQGARLEKIPAIEALGAQVFPVSNENENLNLREVLQILSQNDVLSVFIEGGPHIHTAFLEENLVNELMIYIAPILIGGAAAPTFYMGRGGATIELAQRLERVERQFFGDDTLVRGILRWKI